MGDRVKLRICNDSIRLRLTVSEVAAVAAGEAVRARTRFPGGAALRYALEPADVAVPTATLEQQSLTVLVPRAGSARWAEDETAVSLSGAAALPDGELTLLVEKDFACLAPRPGDDPADLFVNPAAR